MLPADLKPGDFARYPEQARALCVQHLSLLQQMPLSFLPSLLREVMEYDYGFPAEREEIDHQFNVLQGLSPAQWKELFQGFFEIRLPAAKEQGDWINQPARSLEDMSAYLWSTHQMDSFHAAAAVYGKRMQWAGTTAPPGMPRLGVAVVGQAVGEYDSPLFERLRSHGTLFTNVQPQGGLQQILNVLAERRTAHAKAYAHWYVDGGVCVEHDPGLVSVSYAALTPVRQTLLQYIDKEVSKPGMGPEQLRSDLLRLSPETLGMSGDPVMSRFQMKLFTEGSGTQIFSTTFAQWTAREALRRAQATTLLVRYAPRQRQRPMNELLSGKAGDATVDPVGSLIDAEMGAYYQWIDQQRLSGADTSVFVAWFEGHRTAVVVSPSMPRGAVSTSKVDLANLLRLSLA